MIDYLWEALAMPRLSLPISPDELPVHCSEEYQWEHIGVSQTV
jgi:hypothetical protein